MPNSVKYSTTGDTLSIRRGNFYFGVGDLPKGPSSATTYYNSVTPVTSGYTVYGFNTNQTSKISFNSPSNVNQLVTYTNSISGQNFTGASQCLAWYFTQSTYACVNIDYPTIPTSGLTFISDIGSSISYPLSGFSSYSMDAAGAGGSVSYNSGTVYTSEYGGGFQFNGSSGQAICYLPLSTVAFTFVMIARSTTSTWTSGGGLGYGTGYNTSFQIFSQNGSKLVFYYIGSNGFVQTNIGYIEPSVITIPHMYVISSNGTNLHKGYVDNGSPISDTTSLGRTASSNEYTTWGGGFAWLNMVSYVQLYYTRQLSDAEVLSIYNGYAARFDFGLDPDAAAFIVAAGITNSTQKTAINQLVLDLKSYSIWTKMQAIYPFVGGTATSHKYNLKDPRDLDVAYRLQFNGGWTHSSNGIQGDGSTGYADTFAAVSSTAIPNRANHWSSYNKQLPSSAKYTGIFDYPPNLTTYGWYGASGSNWFGGIQNFSNSGVACQTGFINGTVTSASNAVLYFNGSSIYSIGSTTSFGSGFNYYLGAQNSSGPSSYNNALVAFVSLGNSLTATNAANLYTAVQSFQTTLGRQV
jgi:hypothetical protein